MRVYEMSASYSRKVQVKQFEPAEAKFEMKVELEDGDDAHEVRTMLMQEVRDAVTQAFQGGRTGKGAEVKIAQNIKGPEDPDALKEAAANILNGKDEGAKPGPAPAETEDTPKVRGRPKGSKNKPKEETTDVASVLDTIITEEDEESNVVDLNPPKETEPEVPGVPKDEMTLAQVKTLMNKVTGDGIKVPKVRELLAQFGVASTTDLDPSAYPEFFDLLTEIKDEELQL